MKRWIAALTVTVATLGAVYAQQDGQKSGDDATTQPAETQTDGSDREQRKAMQEDILKELIRRRESTPMIEEQDPNAEGGDEVEPGEESRSALMLDGTDIVQRPGQFSRSDDKSFFTFRQSDGRRMITVELLPNSLLEATEREAEGGATDFIVTGTITRYRSRNYLLLTKVVRSVKSDNIAP